MWFVCVCNRSFILYVKSDCFLYWVNFVAENSVWITSTLWSYGLWHCVVQILDMNSLPEHVYLPKKLLCLKFVFSFFDLCGGEHMSLPQRLHSLKLVFQFLWLKNLAELANCQLCTWGGKGRASVLFYCVCQSVVTVQVTPSSWLQNSTGQKVRCNP